MKFAPSSPPPPSPPTQLGGSCDHEEHQISSKRPRAARLSLASFKNPFTATDPSSAQTPSVGHQARVCYAVMTGSIPQESEKGSKQGKRKPLGAKSMNLSEERRDSAATTRGSKQQNILEVKAVVKPKAVKKLKSDLLKPAKARAIVADLKRMDVPLEEEGQVSPCRAYTLDDSTPTLGILNLTSLPFPTTEGGIVGLASSKTGAFEILADVSGTLVRKSGARDESTVTAPLDSVGLFLYWWGYEISLPPPVLAKLAAARSIQQTFFGFLQAFAVAGGAPELAPFIRYISNYIDMEYESIQSQNKGKGVVLAATWLLPVALIARPWDFPPPVTAEQSTSLVL